MTRHVLNLPLKLFAPALAALGLFLSKPALSNNYHEHIYSLPLASDFVAYADKIFDINENNQKLSQIFKTATPSILEGLLTDMVGMNASAAKHLIETKGYSNVTIKDVCFAMGGDPKANLGKFISLQPGSKMSPVSAYINAERFRKEIIYSLDTQTAAAIFEKYFRDEPFLNRSVIEMTVPSDFYSDAQKAKLLAIHNLAIKYGSRTKFYLSVPRSLLNKETFQISQEEELPHKTGLVDGLDISGSILEEYRPSATAKKNFFEEKLLSIMNYASEHRLPLRIHAFEKANEGLFYSALRNALQNFDKPIDIRIGHINKLDANWISFFQEITKKRKIQVSFDANVSSNVSLHGAQSAALEETISKLRALGLTVHLGSDGRGIIEKTSSFIYQDALVRSHAQKRLTPKTSAIPQVLQKPVSAIKAAISCHGLLQETFNALAY
jgi:hypothetical protein